MKPNHIKPIIAIFAITLLFTVKTANAQYNYFAGTSAGSGNSSWYSTAVGYEALSSGNTGISCLALGYHALKNNTTGYHNVGIGNGAMEYNTTGSANTAVGIVALINNTTGYRNSALGNFALWSNTSGYYNTAMGADAMKTNTTGYNNTSTGYKSLYSNTTGGENCAFGHFSSYTSSLALHNNAFGAYSLYYNTGENNCAFGTYVLQGNTTGYANSAYGHQALSGNTTGYQNVGIGDYANDANNTGFNNTSVGSNALHLNLNGSNNVAVGRMAAGLRAKYVNCIMIGSGADATVTNLTNAMALGYNARVSASNKVVIGNTAVTSIGGKVGWTTSSDLRLKTNISQSNLGLDFILSLNPVTYNYRDEEQKDILYTGLIAQEVDASAKNQGVDYSGVDKNGDYWGIRYGDLTVPLIKAVQQMNEELRMKNETLENEIASIKAALSAEQRQQLNSSVPSLENKLEQNNPNPFNQSTVIRYELSGDSKNAKIIIRDLNGNLIKLVSIIQTGKGQITVNANELTQGTYTYTLEIAGNSVDTKLMVVTK